MKYFRFLFVFCSVIFSGNVNAAVGDLVSILSIPGIPLNKVTFTLSINPNNYFVIQNGNQVVEAVNVPPGNYQIGVQASALTSSVPQIFTFNYSPTINPILNFTVGVNLSGAEINFPQWPQLDEMTYLAGRKLNPFRIPMQWAKANDFQGTQGIQLYPYGPLNLSYLSGLQGVINNAVLLGVQIIPDIHMFGTGPGLSGTIHLTHSSYFDQPSSITSSGTTITVGYSSVDGTQPLVNGSTVNILGTTSIANDPNHTPDSYDGTYSIFNVTSSSFQYIAGSVPAHSPALPVFNGNIVALETANIGSSRLPISALADLWGKFSIWLQANAPTGLNYAYDLMNEWAIPDQTVAFNANQAATNAIRANNDGTRLLYEGNNYSGAWDWTDTNANFYQIVDIYKNNSISPHSYPDYNNSGQFPPYSYNIATPGTAPTGINTNPIIQPQRMQRQFVPWLQLHGLTGIVGEHNVSNDALGAGGADNYQAWNLIEDNFLTYAQSLKIPVIWWGNGPGFGTGYPWNLSPTNVGNPNLKDYSGNGLQSTQMVILDKYTGYNGPQTKAYRNDLPVNIISTGNPLAPQIQIANLAVIGTPLSNFLTRYNGLIPSGGFTIIPSATRQDNGASAGGTLTTPTISAGANAIGTFSYTPTQAGYINITTNNLNNLIDPPAIQIVSAADPTPSVAITLPWTGINLTGMESSGAIYPVGGIPYGHSYSNYAHYRGMNIVRLPFKRERVQPRLFGALANTIAYPGGSTGLDALDSSVNDAVQSGMMALIDIHDYGQTLVTIDISSVSVTGTTATCTVADTTILNAGATLTLGATAVSNPTPTYAGAITIVNSTTFTIPVPNGTPSSSTTTGTFTANIGTVGYSNASYADFVTKLAARYQGYPNVAIDLMNEPTYVTAAVMAAASQAAITSVRSNSSFNGYIFAEIGGSYSAANLFSNLLNSVGSFLNDPLNKTIYEVHCYLDNNGSGQSPYPAGTGVGAVSLIDATEYARANGLKLFLGEFGISTVSSMITEVSAQLDYISANTDVWVGWTAWNDNTYVILPVELRKPPFQFPTPSGNVTDQPQMATLVAHGLSSFFAAPPSGINMNWVPGFDGGIIPYASASGTVLTSPMTAQESNIDGPGTTIFTLISNPGNLFSINGLNELVLQGTLVDLTTYPITIQVTNAKGVSAIIAENIITNSITAFDPTSFSVGTYTLSNNNLTITQTSGSSTLQYVVLNKSKSAGKFYFENYNVNAYYADNSLLFARKFGIPPKAPVINAITTPPGYYYLSGVNTSGGLAKISSNVQGTVASISYSPLPSAGTTTSYAWDATNKLLWIRVNGGNWNGSGTANPATGIGGMSLASLPYPLWLAYNSYDNTGSATFNFGASAYSYAPPSGFNNLNFLLKRDLDPALNDNDPMWLEKAA